MVIDKPNRCQIEETDQCTEHAEPKRAASQKRCYAEYTKDCRPDYDNPFEAKKSQLKNKLLSVNIGRVDHLDVQDNVVDN